MAITFKETRNWTITSDSAIFRATNGGTVFSSNLRALSVFDYFTDTAVVNDAIYFGQNGFGTYALWEDLIARVGTAISATSITLVWEYYNAGTSAWSSIVDVQDNTNGFTTIGQNTVKFDRNKIPLWGVVAVNGLSYMWIRCRITAVSGITEGGAQSTQVAKFNDKCIIISGYASGSPATFDDINTADKAGNIDLWIGTPTTNITTTYAMRPANVCGLQIDLILSGTTAGAGDTIDIAGTDANDNAQSESIDVSAGNGTYTTAKFYKTIDNSGIGCNGFADGTLTVRQNQWGVCSKFSTYQFKIDEARLQWSNTYFVDTEKQVLFDFRNVNFNALLYLEELADSNITFGNSYNDTDKATRYGCEISVLGYSGSGSARYIGSSYSGVFNFYSSKIKRIFIKSGDDLLVSCGNATNAKRFWNSSINGGGFSDMNNLDVYNFVGNGTLARRPRANTTVNRVTGGDAGTAYCIWFQDVAGVIRDAVARQYGNAARLENIVANGICRIINADFSSTMWSNINWAGTDNGGVVLRREYTFDLVLSDRAGNLIQNASVILYDVNNSEVFNLTTDSNGTITQQDVIYQTWTRPNGSTPTTLGPHRLVIRKSGFDKYESPLTFDEKIVLTISLDRSKLSLSKFVKF